jgi:mycothiol synthase
MKVRRPRAADAGAVLALLQEADRAVIGESDWTAEDLAADWAELDLEHDAWLVEIDGLLAGYGQLTRPAPDRFLADGYVHPGLKGRGAGGTLLRLTESRARERLATTPSDLPARIQNATLLGDDDECVARLYGETGYVPVRRFSRMVVDLDDEPWQPVVATGLELGPYDPERDAHAVHEALEEAFADHWEHHPATWEEWQRRKLGERFDPGLWFVVRDGEEIAGAIVGQWKSQGDWGWIETLGVRRPWRRRGIAEALLRAAFRAFRQRGETRVALGVDAQSPTGADRLYERVGMRVFWRAVVYEKTLVAG